MPYYEVVVDRVVKVKERHLHRIHSATPEGAVERVRWEEPEPDEIQDLDDHYDYCNEEPVLHSVKEIDDGPEAPDES